MPLTVVTGPPCAGKTTYVQEHAQPGDIVIDLDALASALGHQVDRTTGDYPRHIVDVTIEARKAAIDRAQRWTPTHGVWVIDCAALSDTRARFERMGAQIIELIPPMDVLRDRSQARAPHTWALIEQWFEHHDEHAPSTSRRW